MVMTTISSKDFNWCPLIVEGDDPQKVMPDYSVKEEAETSEESVKIKFADMPSSGIWADRAESDDELLEELGSGWRGFAS